MYLIRVFHYYFICIENGVKQGITLLALLSTLHNGDLFLALKRQSWMLCRANKSKSE